MVISPRLTFAAILYTHDRDMPLSLSARAHQASHGQGASCLYTSAAGDRPIGRAYYTRAMPPPGHRSAPRARRGIVSRRQHFAALASFFVPAIAHLIVGP